MANRNHPKPRKHTDNRKKCPGNLATPTDYNALYDRLVKRTRANLTWAKNNGMIKKIEGKTYYVIPVPEGLRTQKLRDHLTKNYRDAGFSVRVQGDVIYARRK